MNEQQMKKSTKLAKIEGHEFVRRILYGDYIRRGFTDVVLDRILALEAAEAMNLDLLKSQEELTNSLNLMETRAAKWQNQFDIAQEECGWLNQRATVAEEQLARVEEALKDAVGYVYNLYGGNMALADMDTEKWRAALDRRNLESTP